MSARPKIPHYLVSNFHCCSHRPHDIVLQIHTAVQYNRIPIPRPDWLPRQFRILQAPPLSFSETYLPVPAMFLVVHDNLLFLKSLCYKTTILHRFLSVFHTGVHYTGVVSTIYL